MKQLKISVPFALFVVVIVMFGVSLYQRYPNGDEAILAEHSYTLDKFGCVKSNLLGGYLEGDDAWENRQYFYHKFFILTGTLFMKIFGFHLYSFKAVSLLFTLIFFFFLFRYLRCQRVQPLRSFFLLTAALLLFNGHFFDHSFMFRPEIMSMCLGFISFYFLQKNLSASNQYQTALLSGVFAGLAAFTHLNGVIYSFAGVLLLLIRKEFRNAFLFSITAGVFTLLYFFDIHSLQEFQSLLHQFRTDPNVATKAPFYINILKEQQRFFHSPLEITFTLLLVFSLVFNFKYLKENFGNLLLYLLLLVVGLGLLSHGKTPKYGIHYFPYMAIIIVAGYWHIFRQHNFKVKLLGGVLLLGFMAIHSIRNADTIGLRVNIAAHNAELSKLIPEKNVKIAAPQPFVFNEIEHYSSIRGDIAWVCHYDVFHPNEEKSLENYLLFLEQHGDKYVLIDKVTTGWGIFEKAFNKRLILNDMIGCYKLISKSDTFFLFENIGL